MRNVKTFERKNFINLEEIQCRMFILPKRRTVYLNFEKKLPKSIVNKIIGYLKYDLRYNVELAQKIIVIPKIRNNNVIYGLVAVDSKYGTFKYIKPDYKPFEYNAIGENYKLIILPIKTILDLIDEHTLIYELEEF